MRFISFNACNGCETITLAVLFRRRGSRPHCLPGAWYFRRQGPNWSLGVSASGPEFGRVRLSGGRGPRARSKDSPGPGLPDQPHLLSASKAWLNPLAPLSLQISTRSGQTPRCPRPPTTQPVPGTSPWEGDQPEPWGRPWAGTPFCPHCLPSACSAPQMRPGECSAVSRVTVKAGLGARPDWGRLGRRTPGPPGIASLVREPTKPAPHSCEGARAMT